jgi:hypothetical protein
MQLFVRLVGATLCAAALTACTEPFYCTPDAVVWRVTVLDADGAPVTDLHWTAVIASTQDTISHATLAALSAPESGTYAIFTNDRRTPIDPTGEVVRVEGASGLDWFSAEFGFDIPDANCYANRVSGPDTVTLAPAAFTIVNGDRVWGGGDILVISPVFRLVDDSLPFLVVADTVWSRARAGDTAVVRAPVLSGSYPVALLDDDQPVALGDVVVRGYAGAADGPPLSGIIQVWPQGSADPTFFANGPNQLHFVNAASRSVVRAFPDSIHNPLGYRGNCAPGPGVTYDPDAFILCPEPNIPVAWNIGGEEPQLVEASCLSAPGFEVTGLIAPGYWLIGRPHDVRRRKCPENVDWAENLDSEGTEYIRISPRGDRTLVLGNGHRDGAPVLDAAGAVAYRIAAFGPSGTAGGAGFSPDGTTLYAAQRQGLDSIVVLSLDATSGTTLARTALAMRDPPDLLVDTEGGWVYVLGVRAGHWALAVLDLDSLATVAMLETAGERCAPDWPVRLVLGSNQGAVFVVRTSGYWQEVVPENSCIQRFDVWR